MYGGGDHDGFPLVQFVSNFAKSFGQSVLVGEDMFTQITYWDFRQEGQLFPCLRCALLATALSGTKVSDGISKVLVKADLDKLKQSTMKPKVLQGEQVLANSWVWLSSKGLTPERQCKLFGRLSIRVVLHLLKKEKLCAMENEVYEDLQSISDQCVKEANGIQASSAAAASAAQPEDSMGAQDLLSSKPAEIALLQHQHLKIGEKQLACVLTYICVLLCQICFEVNFIVSNLVSKIVRYTCKDYENTIWTMKSISDDKAIFEHQPLFTAKLTAEVEFEKLKMWRPTKANFPVACKAEVAKKFLPKEASVVQDNCFGQVLVVSSIPYSQALLEHIVLLC